MPAISLRCRNCGHELGLDAVGACSSAGGRSSLSTTSTSSARD